METENLSIGEKINPILCEIEDTLWEFEVNRALKPNFPKESLRASAKIFAAVLMDKLFELQAKENIGMDDKLKMAEQAGKDIRSLIKTYTDIDSYDFYKTK